MTATQVEFTLSMPDPFVYDGYPHPKREFQFQVVFDEESWAILDRTVTSDGISPEELDSWCTDALLTDWVVAELARRRSAAARAVPGVLDMLAVTRCRGVITDQERFAVAARRAHADLGSVQKVFITVAWAQTDDLGLDDDYFKRIAQAVSCEQ